MTEKRARKCVHHWILEAPSDGQVRGKCKVCGAEETFPADPTYLGFSTGSHRSSQVQLMKRNRVAGRPRPPIQPSTMEPETGRSQRATKKKLKYEQRRPEIIAAVERGPRLMKASKVLDIPYSSLRVLVYRWKREGKWDVAPLEEAVAAADKPVEVSKPTTEGGKVTAALDIIIEALQKLRALAEGHESNQSRG